ncbi:hypothetical protein [Streptomyces afghaniensis]|uniref:hypothetical protein n=1 Tax=Streptomyces afghaniensis TaxID=66865 RepID=UPI00277D91DE|nr:hypothetical protein [Streptomyces afghaniensis]MDQ1018810.1 hypothetical protein [Streptomyces afghaniensis]
MNPNPWNPRALVGLAALAIVIGVGVAYCDNHDEAQAPADPCAGVAYAIPAGPVQATKTASRKNGDRPPARASKEPRPAATAAVTPPPNRSSSHRPRHEIDLDLDGC